MTARCKHTTLLRHLRPISWSTQDNGLASMRGEVLNASPTPSLGKWWESAFQSTNCGNQMITEAVLPHQHWHKSMLLRFLWNLNTTTVRHVRQITFLRASYRRRNVPQTANVSLLSWQNVLGMRAHMWRVPSAFLFHLLTHKCRRADVNFHVNADHFRSSLFGSRRLAGKRGSESSKAAMCSGANKHAFSPVLGPAYLTRCDNCERVFVFF